MAKYCDIFWSFFKVGAFTLGGGYAMIPLMQRELVERHAWIGADEFTDAVALCQAMPGVFAVNMATMIGNRLRGARGAAAAVLGNVAMPVVLILLLAVFFRSFRGNEVVERIFLGLRPVVVALIAAPVFTLARTAGITLHNCWLPLVAAAAVWLMGVNPIFVVLGAAALGYILKGRRF